jgi:hypothetical protein
LYIKEHDTCISNFDTSITFVKSIFLYVYVT